MASKTIRKTMISEIETISILKNKNLFQIFREPVQVPRTNPKKRRKLDPMTDCTNELFQLSGISKKLSFTDIVKGNIEILEEIKMALFTNKRSFIYDTESEVAKLIRFIDYNKNVISKNKSFVKFNTYFTL